MNVTLITTTYLNGEKTQVKELLKNDDLRLEMIKNIKDAYISWGILDYNFDYKCEQTKYGYKVVKTLRQHKDTRELVIMDFQYK